MNAQLFDGRYRTAKREVRDLWRDGKPTGRDAEGLVAAARDQQEEWRSLGGQGAPRVGESLEEAYSAYGRLTNRLAALGAYLVTRNLYQRSHHHIAEDVSALASDHTTVYRLPRIHELEQLLTARDCAWLLEAVRTGALDGEVAVEAFTHVWLASIRDHLTATDRRLSAFDGGLHRRRADQYANADRRHIDTSADRVRRAVAERAVAARGSHPEQDRVVVGQSKRKRGHMTLRQLFDTAPDVLTALRPCWVMSPLVVSQTLPARQVFDVVIFDEASQVTPADAIPALLRASQAVVAGDERQLPPTDFFGLVGGAADDGDGDDDDGGIRLTTGYEAVLDVLGVLLRPYMLTWHYRSEDERLIAFSNHHIYDGLLTTFPGIAGDAGERGQQPVVDVVVGEGDEALVFAAVVPRQHVGAQQDAEDVKDRLVAGRQADAAVIVVAIAVVGGAAYQAEEVGRRQLALVPRDDRLGGPQQGRDCVGRGDLGGLVEDDDVEHLPGGQRLGDDQRRHHPAGPQRGEHIRGRVEQLPQRHVAALAFALPHHDPVLLGMAAAGRNGAFGDGASHSVRAGVDVSTVCVGVLVGATAVQPPVEG